MEKARLRVCASAAARGQPGRRVWGMVVEFCFLVFLVYSFCVLSIGCLGCTPKGALWLFWCTLVFFSLETEYTKVVRRQVASSGGAPEGSSARLGAAPRRVVAPVSQRLASAPLVPCRLPREVVFFFSPKQITGPLRAP